MALTKIIYVTQSEFDALTDEEKQTAATNGYQYKITDAVTVETWTFTLADGTTTTKKVLIGK